MPAIFEPLDQLPQCTSKEWREQPSRYRLVGSKCKACGRVYFPRRWICPNCGSNEIEEYQLKHKGKVVMSSISYSVMVGWEESSPMQGAAIEIEDGPTIAAEIVESQEELQPGTEVRMTLRKIGKDSIGMYLYAYKFMPVKR